MVVDATKSNTVSHIELIEIAENVLHHRAQWTINRVVLLRDQRRVLDFDLGHHLVRARSTLR